jgi:hypothetical protein
LQYSVSLRGSLLARLATQLQLNQQEVNMKKISMALVISFLALCSTSVCGASDITYYVDMQIGTLSSPSCVANPNQQSSCATATFVGTIETDGTKGPLTVANIVSYDLQFTALASGTQSIAQSYSSTIVPYPNWPANRNSSMELIGSDPGDGLTATTTQLLFDFSGPETLFITSGDENDPYTSHLCFEGSGSGPNCYSPAGYGAEYFSTSVYGFGGYTDLSGEQIIGSTSEDTSATPEPDSCLLMVTGLLVLMGIAYRRGNTFSTISSR